MMTIGIPKRQKKPWVRKENGIIKHKIYNYRKYFVGQKRRSNCGRCFFIHDVGNKLRFFCFSYQSAVGVVEKTSGDYYFVLSVKKGYFNFYKIDVKEKKIRCNNWRGPTVIDAYIQPSRKTRKIYKKRVFKILSEFLLRHGISKDIIKQSKGQPGCLLKYALYPATIFLDQATGSQNSISSPHYTRLYRHPDYRKVIKKFYGSCGSKLCNLIYKAIQQIGEGSVLSLGAVLRDLIPLDYYYDILKTPILREGGRVPYTSHNPPKNFNEFDGIREVLKHYHPTRIKTLVKCDPLSLLDYNGRDIARIYKNYNVELPEKPNSLGELHDCLSLQIRKQTEKNVEFNLSKELQDFNGSKLDSFTFEVPKDRYKVMEYGEKMHHCIASYATSMKDGAVLLLGIYENAELKYNISIRNKQLDQFKAKYNAEPSRSDYEKICNFLVEKKLLKKQYENEYLGTWN